MSIPDTPNRSGNEQEIHACETVSVQAKNGSLPALLFATLMFAAMMIVATNVSANSIVALDESAELTSRLLKAFKELPADYEPRTEHFGADGAPEFINRLVAEDSPYLLQHAHNPVNWFPWGQEAFERAVSENKPVFLSIGYATCHWCHVMERESFENKEIADIINEHFIAIKVDREQRPDVDSTYMTAVQMMTGGGGWPLSSFLVPTSSPFYGGTYYPPETFKDLLLQINTAWIDKEQEVVDQASRVAAALVEVNQTSAKAREVGEKEIEAGVRMLLRGFDDLQGGFGQAPKFPREPALYLLLENAARTGNTEVLYAAYFTLQRIAAGGIHDHVAGGFHRYAVDNEWLVPHFEKMLYNQAALSRNFVQSWQLTADQEHGRVARRVLDYVAREMTSADGGFYSATDADSEGHEGVFFIWTPAQLTEALGAEDAKLASTIWSTSEEGNFEGSNILHLQGTIAELASNLKMPVAELTSKIDQMSEKLLKVRGKRIAPLLDDKVITAWNGMMITAFAEAGSAMNEQRYIDIAVKAAKSILKTNSPETGVLWRTSYAGRSSVPANQADYAFLAEAFLTLYDATGDAQWLGQAEKLAETMDSRFLDTDNGGYFMGSPVVAGASMPVRPKELFDNATPSGNSVAMRVLSGLYYRTGNDTYREKAEALLTAFSDQLVNQPESQAYLLKAVSELLYGEAGETQYTARGKVRVKARIVPNENSAGGDTLQLTVNMQDGWHINANKPLQKYLIGTTITHTDGSEIAGVKYPEPIVAKLGFERSELALYEEAVVIEVALDAIDRGEQLTDAERPGPALAVVPVSINLQACNDTVCLAPETLTLSPSMALARAAAL